MKVLGQNKHPRTTSRSSPILPDPTNPSYYWRLWTWEKSPSKIQFPQIIFEPTTSSDLRRCFFFFPGILLDPTLSLRRPQALGVDTEKQDKMLSERKKSMFWGAPSLDSIQLGMLKWEGKGLCPPKVLKITGVAWACVFLLELPPQKRRFGNVV